MHEPFHADDPARIKNISGNYFHLVAGPDLSAHRHLIDTAVVKT
jgi:hypothetical protein